MRNKFIFCFVLLVLGSARANCLKASILEDVSLPGQKSGEGFYNLLSIPDGLEAMCEIRPFRTGLFEEARSRLNKQRELMSLLVAAGELRPNEVRYYKAFYTDVEINLNSCEREAIRLRQTGLRPKAKKLVELTIRPSNIIDLFYLSREGGVPRKHIISHKTWFGRIIQQDGYDLCQTLLK